jgi:hypothetical protein
MDGMTLIGALKLAIFWGGWLYVPAAPALVWLAIRRRGAFRLASIAVLAALTALAYARFVEPRILLVSRHAHTLDRCFAASGEARLGVVSDLHIGMFPNAMPTRRIARAIKAAQPDFVLIAGDFTYYPDTDRLESDFRALGSIGAPAYAVLGNHDVGFPGPPLKEKLAAALAKIGVTLIDNRRATPTSTEIDLYGLSDLDEGLQQRSILRERRPNPRLLLTHNPETILELAPAEAVDLMVAGHTHGGQIWLYGISCLATPDACRVTPYGFEETKRGLAFVTSGTGMVDLPMRFNRPPKIDIIDLTWKACDPARPSPAG